MIILRLRSGGVKSRTFEFMNQRLITIGRWQNNDLILEDPAVSGHHANIERIGDAFHLFDLKSQNGTLVNRERVTSCLLQSGDVIRLGNSIIDYTFTDLESKFDALEARRNPKTDVIDIRKLGLGGKSAGRKP
jgi:pSer/pThr/pTyr-binding forkhead associated (FHA) protein